MIDIVAELRAGQWRRDQVRGLCERAAAVIERLRSARRPVFDGDECCTETRAVNPQPCKCREK